MQFPYLEPSSTWGMLSGLGPDAVFPVAIITQPHQERGSERPSKGSLSTTFPPPCRLEGQAADTQGVQFESLSYRGTSTFLAQGSLLRVISEQFCAASRSFQQQSGPASRPPRPLLSCSCPHGCAFSRCFMKRGPCPWWPVLPSLGLATADC